MSSPARDEPRLQRIERFKRETHPSSEWQYSFRDVILYALSIGCRRTERNFVYENDTDFATLPSFAVVAVHKAGLPYQDLLPNFDPVNAHGWYNSGCAPCLLACTLNPLAFYSSATCCDKYIVIPGTTEVKVPNCTAENAAAWGAICGNFLSTANTWQICCQTQPH